MTILDLILKKKRGEALTEDEICFFVQEVATGRAADYQVSALLMAICFQGLQPEETTALTLAMAASGEQFDLSPLPGVKVDKHSTGGVGDKTSLIVLPLVAAAGISAAKMSGRGLGHTGGTLDKLESIPGLSTSLGSADFFRQVQSIGLAIAGQTANLAPADKKLYALRDVTGTVDQMGLIAASIMSKKLAAGADRIVLDVKFGSGAFMQRIDDARELARQMVAIGERAGRPTHALLSNMEQPLGCAVGNRLEVYEALQVLQNSGPADLRELSLNLAAEMVYLARSAKGEVDRLAIRTELEKKLKNGAALTKFREMISWQRGDLNWIDEPGRLLQAEHQVVLRAESDGYLAAFDCQEVGLASTVAGAGRQKKEDILDMTAGIVFFKKQGELVRAGEPIARIQGSDQVRVLAALERLRPALHFTKQNCPDLGPLILERIEGSAN